MARQFFTARRYLAPDPDTFWEWQDDGQVIVWRAAGARGRTIAFRVELERVLNRLSSHGLPPMDAVVMFLAACRAESRPDGSDIFPARLLPEPLLEGTEDRLFEHLNATLKSIAELPAELRNTSDRKAELAAVVFEAAKPAETCETAESILLELKNGFGAEMLSDRRPDGEPTLLFRLAPIASGLVRVDAVRLALRQATGLEQLPSGAEPEKPEAESFTALLRSLELDEELGGMIRLTRHLIAALTLPRAVSEQQDLPLGGVSDITNRGSLDRLLVSELAHDDLTFTVRVALNEALYLRREAPPNVPPRQRMVLIDSGLRMWGVPRVFAAAAALALAGTRRAKDEFTAYRPRAAHLDHVDLKTRAGLVAHLGALEATIHPGAALPTFQRLLREAESASEAVLITAEDVLADKSFRQALAEFDQPLYVVSVHRSGKMRLTRRTPQGMKLLREMQYELARILAPVPKITPLIDASIDPSLPAILRLKQFPLLLPHSFDADRMWGEAGHDVLCLTHDRRLMHWTERRLGGRQITDRLPPGKLHWQEFRPAERTSSAVVGRLSQHGLALLQVNLKEQTCQVTMLGLQQHNPLAVTAHAGAVFVIFADLLELFAMDTGQPLGSHTMPIGMTWFMGRFFRSMSAHGERSFYAVSYNGNSAVFEKICDSEPRDSPATLIGLFDADGVEGPVGMTRLGEFRYFCGGTLVAVPSKDGVNLPRFIGGFPKNNSFRFGAVSSDGRRLVLISEKIVEPLRGNWLLEPHLGKSRRIDGDPQTILQSPLLAGLTRETLRTRFHGIYADGDELWLIPTTNNPHLCVGEPGIMKTGSHADDSAFQLVSRINSPDYREVRFRETATPRGAGYRLSLAEWADGSRAVLDSRGLLHLKSSDAAIAELTMVLGQKGISGWCSDGRVWGKEFFVGDVPRTGAKQIFEEVLRPFIRRLR
jgi:hypothetical protein